MRRTRTKGRLMESPHDFCAVHWDPEPNRFPLNRPSGTFSPIGGEGWDEGDRFMERERRMGKGGVSGFPIVACPAIHYATPQDRRRYDILQSIRTLTWLEGDHPGNRPCSRAPF